MKDVSLRLIMEQRPTKKIRMKSQKQDGIIKNSEITMRISEEDKAKIKTDAAKRGQTVTVYILECIKMAQTFYDFTYGKEHKELGNDN